MAKLYAVRIVIEGEDTNYTIDAHNVMESYFLAGIRWGQEHPDNEITTEMEGRVTSEKIPRSKYAPRRINAHVI